MDYKNLSTPILKRSAIDEQGIIHYLVEGGLTKRDAATIAVLQGLYAHYGVSYGAEHLVREALGAAEMLFPEDVKNDNP